MSEFDHFDCILKRDWFVSDEDILDLLDQASPGTFKQIYNSRHTYSDRIRYQIDPADFSRDSRVKLKVVEMTDKDLKDIEDTKHREFVLRCQSEWEIYKDTIGERPHEEIDDELDDKWRMLDGLKTALDIHIKKYMKFGTDQKKIQLEDSIKKLENEYSNLKELISKEDNHWLEEKKNEFIGKML